VDQATDKDGRDIDDLIMESVQLGIIIPVYNEADNIGRTLEAIKRQVKTPHAVYIVYDFEEDNTLPVARGYQQSGYDIRFLMNPDRGCLGAIRTGLRQAEIEYLLVSMADMSDDYGVVDRMVGLMGDGYDLVCGSRYMKGGRQTGGPLIKKTLSRVAGVSLHYLSGIPTHDITNSFKLYRKAMVDTINIESDGGFEIGMEIAVKAHLGGFKVTEIPCSWTDREAGKSRFRIMKWAPKYLKWYFLAIKKNL
jgi:glycosyltransferase involved in cell wall biosynthesis